ncbi:MAG: glycerate kinase [Anaerolineales bacterium]|nr:glycerate kinase [Anaerolineales bacterium]
MNFKTHSLQDPRIVRILQAAFDAVEPGRAVRRFLNEHPLPPFKRIFVFGLGKAACAMANGLTGLPNLTHVLIITKHASRLDLEPVTVIEGDHPVPGQNSLAAGRTALDFVSQLTPDDLLLCLISGGGSALMTAPIIPLSELQALTSQLLANGSRIDEINTLRRHLDLLKGGGLAKAANGARIVSLILSDVVSDSLETIASGPTAPDPTTVGDVRRIANLPYDFRETLKPDDPIFRNIENHIIASNGIALQAAKRQAEVEGFYTEILYSGLQGEAREVGEHLAHKLKEASKKYPRPFCLLAGGEMTVTIQGNGRGGRNQELVLGAVESLRAMKDVLLLSIATDGEDGPTDAAGAVAIGESAQRAESLGMSTTNYLSRNDAYAFFDPLGDLLKPGPSGTNVNDLMLLFSF